LTPTVAMGRAVKRPVPDRVKPVWHSRSALSNRVP